jgi:MFS family permease
MKQPRYYGWSIVTVLAITETLSYGMLIYAFSVFVVPLESHFGWSRATISAGVTAAQLVAGALAWPVGVWLDRHGARWLMTGAAVWAACWFVLWSMVNALV